MLTFVECFSWTPEQMNCILATEQPSCIINVIRLQHISCSINWNALSGAWLGSSSYPYCILRKGHCQDRKVYMWFKCLDSVANNHERVFKLESKINFNLLFFTQCSVYFLVLRFSAMLGALLIKEVCSFLRLPDSHKPSLFKTDTPDFAHKIKATCIFTRKHLVKWVFILEKFHQI